MVGLPKIFNTRQDYLNACEYAQAQGNAEQKRQLRKRLMALNSTR